MLIESSGGYLKIDGGSQFYTGLQNEFKYDTEKPYVLDIVSTMAVNGILRNLEPKKFSYLWVKQFEIDKTVLVQKFRQKWYWVVYTKRRVYGSVLMFKTAAEAFLDFEASLFDTKPVDSGDNWMEFQGPNNRMHVSKLKNGKWQFLTKTFTSKVEIAVTALKYMKVRPDMKRLRAVCLSREKKAASTLMTPISAKTRRGK